MKKFIMLIILLLCVVGCEEKKLTDTNVEVNVGKIDESKEYVSDVMYKSYTLSNGETYEAKWLDINLNSEEVSNLSLTLKNNILLQVKSFELINNIVNKGTIVDYNHYVSDKYISIVESNKSYNNGSYVTNIIKTYNIDIKTGIIVDNTKLIDDKGYNEDDIFNKIKESNLDDADYVAMYVKNNGYSLYVNENNQLVIVFDYVSDDVEYKKELILVD